MFSICGNSQLNTHNDGGDGIQFKLEWLFFEAETIKTSHFYPRGRHKNEYKCRNSEILYFIEASVLSKELKVIFAADTR